MSTEMGVRCCAVAYLICTSSCGGRTSYDADAAGGGPPASGGSSSSDPGEAGVDGLSAGRITVGVSRYQSVSSYTATAYFSEEEPNTPDSCPSDGVSAGECCCTQLRLPGLLVPEQVPHAGTVTISSDGGTTSIATLEPRPDNDSFAGRYDPVDCLTWAPGDTLSISASGDRIHAFSGLLPTGSSVSGISFLAGAGPIIIATTDSLQIAWEPEQTGDQTVTVAIWNDEFTCSCVVLDSLGRAIVDASLTHLFSPSSAGTGMTSGTIRLERSHTAETSSDNATILLVSQVVESGDVTFQ
ncbi:MAG: hypothetical protein JW751_13870 [Polyangiaceae bacterium]|nr:hypothetical protein [Polyangiaceae bacterium]